MRPRTRCRRRPLIRRSEVRVFKITGAVEEGHPLTDHDEIYALRYATMTGRQPHQNYLLPDVHNEGTDLGYFVWLIRGEAGDILVNTGFN